MKELKATARFQADRIAKQEVLYCVSLLISELAKQYFEDLHGIMSQDDWLNTAYDFIFNSPEKYTQEEAQAKWDELEEFKTYQDFCHDNNLDPQVREALEHWLVSDWLADKLIEKGEMVEKDFMGLTIWGRTTSGQHISIDSVIENIAEEITE